MRVRRKIAIAVVLVALLVSVHAAEQKAAIFDFEPADTSFEGPTYGPLADQQQRLVNAGNQLRDRLAKSGRVDVAAVAAQAHAVDVRNCAGDNAKFARDVAADYSIVGRVQKASNLILNMNITAREAESGRIVAVESADMPGNTDGTWSRALDWPSRYQLLAGQGIFR
jgi:hypothetical protein